MAPRHKYADASVAIATSLDAQRISQLCEEAAKQSETLHSLVRLEEVQPARLVYSVRSRMTGGFVEFMTFEVTLRESDGRRDVRTRLLRYKVKRQWPMPWQMVSWVIYRNFMYALEAGVREVDPGAKTNVVELVGAS